MKRFWLTLWCLLLCCCAGLRAATPPPVEPAAGQQHGGSPSALAKARERGTLRVALEPDFPPMYWVNENGKEDGFDYQLATLIAKELGIPAVAVIEGDYADLPARVVADEADLAMGGYVPDPSIPGIAWSDAYLDFGLSLIVPKDSKITTIGQLRGKTIGAYEDPAAVKWINDNIPERKAVLTYQGVGWLQHLAAGDVDAIIYDFPFANEEVKAFPDLKISAFNLNESNYAIGLRKGDDSLRDAVNLALGKIKGSRAYTELIKKYLPFKISSAVPQGSVTVTVKPGDVLSKIAQRELGSSAAWTRIWELNKHRIPNPNLIEVGDVLIMPGTAPPSAPPTPVPTRPAPPPGSPDTLQEARARGSLRIALEPDFPPMYWIDEGGKEDGFDYHLARLIATELGIPAVTVVEGDYADLPARVVEDKADMAMGGYVPDDSIPGISWSDGYLDFGLCLIVPRGSTMKTITQLKGKRIGAYEDPAAVKWINENIPGRKSVSTYQGAGWLSHLESRDVDAIIYDFPFANEEVKAFKGLQIAAFNLNESFYAIGLRQGDERMREAVNTALTKIRAAGAYADLIRKYLPFKISSDIPQGTASVTVKPGEVLSKIAQRELGSAAAWTKIWELNKHRIPNPNLIGAGDVLIMPASR